MLIVSINFSFKEEGGPWEGRNILKGGSKVICVRGMEPPCYTYQETGCWVSETVGQNWWVSFTMMKTFELSGKIWNFKRGCIFGLLEVVLFPVCFISFISQHRYLQTSALLAGDVNLTTAERQHFFQEILNFPGKSGDKCKWYSSAAQIRKNIFFGFIVHYQSVMFRASVLSGLGMAPKVPLLFLFHWLVMFLMSSYLFNVFCVLSAWLDCNYMKNTVRNWGMTMGREYGKSKNFVTQFNPIV